MKEAISYCPVIHPAPSSGSKSHQHDVPSGYSFSSDTAVISKRHGRKFKPISNINSHHSYTKFATKETKKNNMVQKSRSPNEKKLHDTKERRNSSLKSLNTYRLRPVRIRKDDIVVSL